MSDLDTETIRKLSKALAVAEKLKRDCLIEKQVNKELGRRNRRLLENNNGYEKMLLNIAERVEAINHTLESIRHDLVESGMYMSST